MSLILVIGIAKWIFMGIITIKVFENKKQKKKKFLKNIFLKKKKKITKIETTK